MKQYSSDIQQEVDILKMELERQGIRGIDQDPHISRLVSRLKKQEARQPIPISEAIVRTYSEELDPTVALGLDKEESEVAHRLMNGDSAKDAQGDMSRYKYSTIVCRIASKIRATATVEHDPSI